MSPSERIAELARQVVDRRMEQDSPKDAKTAEFMMKLMGIGKADVAEKMLTEPMTWVVAICAYLEEIEVAKSQKAPQA